MNKISYIKWEPKYSVGVEILDEQHRKLFDIVNDLIDEIEMGSKNILPIIGDLVAYISVHFKQESIVMMESNYPGFMKHSQEHRHFTEKVQDFLQDYEQGNEELGLKMIVFLKEWIFNHTTRLDLEYAHHLKDNADKLNTQ
jgi:hemerythrin-like metal-binding protein